MTTTDGFESRSAGDCASANDVVVGDVVFAVRRRTRGDPLPEFGEAFRRRIPRNEHRADARAQEVIGTARAERAELLGPLRRRKRQRILRAVPVRDRPAIRRDDAAQIRQNRGRDRGPIAGRLVNRARRRTAADSPAADVLVDELAHLVDGADAVQVALLLRLAPREQAVAAEDDPVAAGIAPRRRGAASAPARSPGAARAPRRSCGRTAG